MGKEQVTEKKKAAIRKNEAEISVSLILQNILSPENGTGFPEVLYFRRESWDEKTALQESNPDRLVICKGKTISFDTYLNSLSIGKWKKYTTVESVSLILRCSGAFEVSLTRICDLRHGIQKEILKTETIRSETPQNFRFTYPKLPDEGILAWEMKALADGASFYGGCFEGTLSETPRDSINIAVNICTYKREAFVLKNLMSIRENFLENPESPLYGHIQVFVTDNGQTLDLEALKSETIHVVYNKDKGGSGGYTRGLIEIMESQYRFTATNVIFMDDDVVFLPESFLRLYAMLRCLKTEYEDATIGGAMLCLTKPEIQYENGAIFTPEGKMNGSKMFLPLVPLQNVVKNEIEESLRYNGWFFCCVTMKDIRPDNLPLPFFMKYDDSEYALRNQREIITLNGICVWHLEFHYKMNDLLEYYLARNRLFTMALHIPEITLKRAFNSLNGRIIHLLFYYRYSTVEFLTKALEDWLKGVDFLLYTDSEALDAELTRYKVQMVPFEELELPENCRIHYVKDEDRRETKISRVIRKISLNGTFLPVNRKTNEIRAVSVDDCQPVDFYRQQRVICFDPGTGKAFIAERDLRRGIELWLRFRKAFRMVCASQKMKQRNFRERYKEITNLDFWKKYLGNSENYK